MSSRSQQTQESRQGSLLRNSLGLIGVVAALAWAFVRAAPRVLPGQDQILSKALSWPMPNLDSMQAYDRTSPLGPLVAKMLGVSTPLLWTWLNLVVLLVGACLLSLWAYRVARDAGQGYRAARLAMLVPALGSAFVLIGGYDAFTYLLLGLLLWSWTSGRWWLLGLSGVALGFQHFEQSLFATAAFGLAVIALRGSLPTRLEGMPTPFWATAGTLVGKLVLSLVLVFEGINPMEGRSAYLTPGLVRSAIREAINFGPAFVISLFCGFWIFVIFAFRIVATWRRRLLLLAAIALPLLMSVITLSQTRVFAMMTLPLVMLLVLVALNSPQLASIPIVLIAAEALAWLVVPLHLDMSPEHGIVIFSLNSADNLVMLLVYLTGQG